jgi:thiosulfate/3-mercaptopyruvate sulfurtransferase
MFDRPIVSTDWLHEYLDVPNLRIVDIRGHVIPASEPKPHYFAHHAEYTESHIPGAVFVDWVLDITDPDSPNQGHIAQPKAYAALMSRLGIGDDTTVVIYDDAQSMFSARMWWSLQYYGHSHAAILDGGWNKWVAEQRPITAEIPSMQPAQFTARPQSAIRTTIDQVAQVVAGECSGVLMDVRSPEEFAGKSSRAKRMGHIPGAVNLPRSEMVNKDGTLPTTDQIRETLRKAGITSESPQVIVYCNAGVSASYGYLMLQLAGIQHVSNFDGSWKEWGNDETHPIE